jgi:hypothetical protein
VSGGNGEVRAGRGNSPLLARTARNCYEKEPVYQGRSLAMQTYLKMFEVLESARADVEAAYEKGNKAAITRVRKSMQELKTLAQQFRQELIEKRNEISQS